jgi:glyoxylase-like metal-dependent hydrolase (beta-lactamase superfamily II)
MTRTAWLTARMLRLDEQEVPPPETIEFWTQAGMCSDIMEERKSGKPFNFADAVSVLPLGFRRIVDNEEIEIGNRIWKVRVGNGHAPEHATLWSNVDDIVIAGDQIISSISPNLGVYATEPNANPVKEWIDTCHKLSAFASDKHLTLPGHKLPFTGLKFRLKQMVENHELALNRLVNFLEKPHTAEECFSILFGKSIQKSEYGLALVEAVAHVNYLYLEGTVSRVLDKNGAFRYQALS